jgi:cellulose synthase/poly-beta-1,6-N-acetylglucosamine synthase-like glycosyltransferase
MALLFWLSLLFVGYAYIGYPALLAAWAWMRPKPPSIPNPLGRPAVSIILAVRNEGPRLAARLDNLLELDYPADRRQIIVVSDGSTDGTLAVLDRYRSVVDVVAIAAGGKAQALNAGVKRARHELLVFADARQRFSPDAVIELTAPFADPAIGAVSGELVFDGEPAGRRLSIDRRSHPPQPTGPQGVAAAGTPSPMTSSVPCLAIDRRATERRRKTQSTIADGIGVYWRFEKWMRQHESVVGSTLGTTGAIYAMRRALWKPLPADTILDDVVAPMRCVLAGYRVVFNPRARAFDRPAADAQAESRRKIRTLAGNYQLLCREPRLLLPWCNAVWFQYASHKLARLVVPYALIALMASNIALADRSAVYAFALAGQCAFYLLAGYGAWLDFKESRPAGVATSLAGASLAAPASGDRRTIDG